MADKLSARGHYNLAEVVAKIPKTILEPPQRENTVDLSMAENHLIREQTLAIIQDAISNDLQSQHLDWPKGLWGDHELLELLARLFNSRFGPSSTVDKKNLTITPGAAAALDAILYSICDTGDGILVPVPYWGGYDAFFRGHSGVVPVEVRVPDFDDAFGPALIDALETAYQASPCRIRGVMLCNPHNPLGRCYSKNILEQCVNFCRQRGLHLISDEVFALSNFKSYELESPQFQSVLSLDLGQLGCDPEWVHVIWSMSKDLAVSGVRLGCIVTRNQAIRDTVALITSVHVSTLSTVASKAILKFPGLPDLLAENSRRLSQAYEVVTSFFESHKIEYYPCDSAMFVCAKLAPHVKSIPEELAALHRYSEAGVLVAPGVAYHMNQRHRGWMRVSFAVSRPMLEEGLARIGSVYHSLNVI